ncbi:hypothetical protein CBR_g4720 [Chara braunii]|uniref:DUF659 domain-containing protein n=1 Tax=Chara braunii TaxID=69332 RepID=A0A388KIM4_CHABU|nr:hypothetical protein CBR_g4720 [Chara braunii]|eukprot:GBG69892.1 hypothetical protein CBR_g4720 [Chara braunii]
MCPGPVQRREERRCSGRGRWGGGREIGHGEPDQPLGGRGGGIQGDVIIDDREARGTAREGFPGHEDQPEFDPLMGERIVDWQRQGGKGQQPPGQELTGEGSSKRKEGGAVPASTQAGKRLRQQKVDEVYGGEWVARHKKTFLHWLYSSGVSFNAFRNDAWRTYQQVLLQQPGSSPRAVLPSHSEIASMQAVERHRAELAEELEEVRQTFWVTGATILSDRRKSRDGRPIVNFLATGSRGVVMYTTINREGEPDDAVHVLWRWVTIFHEFRFGGPQRVNAICTDSASAYVGAARALTSETMPAALRRITWLPCSVHVCNKLLSDMGTSCDAFVDTITRARVLVVFFKTHQTALHFFRKRSPNLGLVLSCETRFASVYSMLERLMALQDTLQDMMRGDDARVFASIPWSVDVCYMARWVRRQIRWDPWWQRVAAIVHIMEPVMQLLRRMDRGGQFMSLVLEWAQALVKRVKEACTPLGSSIADRIIKRVQAHSQHMLEPAHCVWFLLSPRRRHVRYFSGEVQEYHAWLVRQAKRYILTQTGFDLEGAECLLACRQFEDFHMQQGRFGDWGGAEGRARGRACGGDTETIECASWWSQYGARAPELQWCALRVMHMWSCVSPAERNWAVHEGIHTKKRNRLAFEKVVQLVEITANVRLTEYRRAGCGYMLPWQRDEGMLDCQAGLELEPVRTGTRQGMTATEIAEQVALLTRDPIGSSTPPSADAVFERRACIFHPYPRDDDSDEEPAPEGSNDPALPIPSEIDETHEEANDVEVRTYTARRPADRAEEEMQGGGEDLWGPFGEVASTGDARADRGGASHADMSRAEAGRPTPAPICAYLFLKKRETILVEFEKQGMDAALCDGSSKLVDDASLFKDCPPYMGCEDDKTIKATEKIVLNKKLSADWKNKVLSVLTGSRTKSMEVVLAEGIVHVLWKDSGDMTSIAPFGVDPPEVQMRVMELEKAVGTTKCHTCVLDLCELVDFKQWKPKAFESSNSVQEQLFPSHWTVIAFIPPRWDYSFMTSLRRLPVVKAMAGKWVKKAQQKKSFSVGNNLYSANLNDHMYILFKGDDLQENTSVIYDGRLSAGDAAAVGAH